LRWQTTFKIAIALGTVVACGGGGAGKGGAGGTGGTAAPGGSSGAGCSSAGPAITTLGQASGPFSSTIDPSTPLSSLTSAQIGQLCSQIDNYVSQSDAISGWFGCRYLAMLSVIQVDAYPPDVIQGQCQSYYQACVGSPTPTLTANVGFSIPWGDLGFTICTELKAPSSFVFSACAGHPLPSGCTATVADVGTCLNDIDAALATADGMNPTCDDPTLVDDAQYAELELGNTPKNGILGLPTQQSCVTFQNKCPNAYGGYMVSTGGSSGASTGTGGMPGGPGTGGAGAGPTGFGGVGAAAGRGGGVCVPPRTNGAGGAGMHASCQSGCACAPGTTCCNGECVDTATNIMNCGACGQPCIGSIGTPPPYCANGTCQTGWPCTIDAGACGEGGNLCCGTQCCGQTQLCCYVSTGPDAGTSTCADPYLDGTCPN
jgi:hypothetical protein